MQKFQLTKLRITTRFTKSRNKHRIVNAYSNARLRSSIYVTEDTLNFTWLSAPNENATKFPQQNH